MNKAAPLGWKKAWASTPTRNLDASSNLGPPAVTTIVSGRNSRLNL